MEHRGIPEKNGLGPLFRDIEIPLVPVLAAMEKEGINLDEGFLRELSVDLDKDILELEKKIYAEADTDFNLASPKQLGVVLFEKLQLMDKPKKTRTGQYATGEEILSKLAGEHQIVYKPDLHQRERVSPPLGRYMVSGTRGCTCQWVVVREDYSVKIVPQAVTSQGANGPGSAVAVPPPNFYDLRKAVLAIQQCGQNLDLFPYKDQRQNTLKPIRSVGGFGLRFRLWRVALQ